MPGPMPRQRRASYNEMTVDELRAMVKEHREQTLLLKRHFERIQKEYEDWEDRVAELDKIIYQAEKDTGIVKEEVYTPTTAVDDLLEFAG